ncbi:MAG TPA: hypothetical protein VF129_10865 [Actinomycetota bacterium]
MTDLIAQRVMGRQCSRRERLGIEFGDVLDFGEEHGRLIAQKVSLENPFDALRGSLRERFRELGFETTDEAIEAMRGPVDLPES